MNVLTKKLLGRSLRKSRVRAKISGTPSRPRLSVTISNLHVSAQLIDDINSKTLASATSVGRKMDGSMKDKAAKVGEDLAKKAKKAKLTQVVFDRNGRRFAGRLKALADAVKQEGLEF